MGGVCLCIIVVLIVVPVAIVASAGDALGNELSGLALAAEDQPGYGCEEGYLNGETCTLCKYDMTLENGRCKNTVNCDKTSEFRMYFTTETNPCTA